MLYFNKNMSWLYLSLGSSREVNKIITGVGTSNGDKCPTTPTPFEGGVL
ncbi:hypothetical protein EDWATA_01633 [Edwardsiella tarda ATCC 23685]|uniref:Uncharacterized protein n=1 Tax=Edwardsiella tarda ATCC 23685 TaxID=500638 RepID=D4F4G2_EDWTA|nr:hypothetical protein EDWATA_01633 [Edwardsiella tarda ATCC 23685]